MFTHYRFVPFSFAYGLPALAIVFFFMFSMAHPALAYRVEPLVYEMTPSGSGALTQLQLENTNDEPLTIEITPSRIEMNETGEESYQLAEDDFLIFPPQAIIPPGKSQAIQVRYIGDPKLSKARVYAIVVSQVPVNLTAGDGAQIKMGVNFRTKAFVVPPKAEAALHVADISPAPQGMAVRVTIENRGDNYANLTKFNWTLSNASGASVKLTKEQLGFVGATVILPGKRRVVSIPNSAVGSLTDIAKLDLKAQK